ncbi:16192_t:CDS:2, partial [Cetraspora pellucida]
IISGMNIQLYGINKDSCRAIYNNQGVNIDKKSFSMIKKFGNNSVSFTSKSYRIQKNIKNIHNGFKLMIDNDEGSNVIKNIIEENMKHYISLDILLDDLIKIAILEEIQIDEISYEKIAKCKILNAFIYEVLRYESSFSLLNNQETNDLNIFNPSRFIDSNYLGSDFFIPFGKGIRECS